MSQTVYSTQVHGAVLDDYLKHIGVSSGTPTYLNEVKSLVKHICPHLDGEIIHAPYDSSFESIFEYAKQENAVLGLAHPGFTLQNMNPDSMLQNIKSLIKKSRGRLVCAENYHQAYPKCNITTAEIQRTNEIMKQLKLVPIGGRDMHRNNFKF